MSTGNIPAALSLPLFLLLLLLLPPLPLLFVRRRVSPSFAKGTRITREERGTKRRSGGEKEGKIKWEEVSGKRGRSGEGVGWGRSLKEEEAMLEREKKREEERQEGPQAASHVATVATYSRVRTYL